jgi:hypothetical protein
VTKGGVYFPLSDLCVRTRENRLGLTLGSLEQLPIAD